MQNSQSTALIAALIICLSISLERTISSALLYLIYENLNLHLNHLLLTCYHMPVSACFSFSFTLLNQLILPRIWSVLD